MMTVHHFTPSELRDMTDQITSRTITEATRRGPTQSDHGVGNHRLRFVAMIPGENGAPSMPDLARGRFCDECKYTDRMPL